MRATFSEAHAAAARRGDWKALGVVDRWWAYLATLRDVDGQIALIPRSLDTSQLGDPSQRIRAQMVSSRQAKPIVAEQLGRRAIAALFARDETDAASDILAALAETLEVAGRGDDATALTEEPWASGCTSAVLLDRLSSRLERAEDYTRAVLTPPRGCRRLPPAAADAGKNWLTPAVTRRIAPVWAIRSAGW